MKTKFALVSILLVFTLAMFPTLAFAKNRLATSMTVAKDGSGDFTSINADKDSFYAEYQSKGPRANPVARVPWSHQLTKSQTEKYTLQNIFRGWNPIK